MRIPWYPNFRHLKSGINAVKAKVDSGVMAQVIDKVTPHIQPHLDKVLAMSADNVKDDEKYETKIVSPTLLAVSAASSGVSGTDSENSTVLK